MNRSVFAAAGITIICGASLAYAFSTGPLNGRTGAPGESNCTVLCHSTSMLNAGPGVLQLGAPTSYTPGGTISVTVDLSLTGQQRWGFECTVLDSNDLPVGQLVITDPTRTQLSTDGITSRQYVKHTLAGTDLGVMNTAPGWSFDWTAPNVNVGPVTFWCAGNAANGNLFNTGDSIYTTSFTVNQVPSVFAFLIDEGQANSGAGTGSSATGFCVAVLNSAQTQLSLYVEHNVANVTGAHIHLGAPGVSGGIRFGIASPSSPISETWAISPADVASLLAGDLYVNIHSTAFLAGEIRGQMVQDPIKFAFTLDEAQANGGAGTGSCFSGFAIGELTTGGASFDIDITHDIPSADVIDGHIHLGAPGVPGTIQFGFSSLTSPITESWALDTNSIKDLLAGNLYANVHTNAWPGGEIRGQIARQSLTWAFSLTEAEANGGAGTGSSATGFGAVTLNDAWTELSIHAEHDVSGASVSHIHLGAPGVVGAVQFGFASAVSPIIDTWSVTPSDIDNLLAGELYLNIHSFVFMNGEIRGQIDPDPINMNVLLDESQADACAGTGSAATGDFQVALKAGGQELTIQGTHDVSNPVDAHVHRGLPCTPLGPIVYGYSSFTSPVKEIWYLTAADVIDLMQGELYTNVHSAAFPLEEIRGHLVDAAPSGCCAVPGDFNHSGGVDIADLSGPTSMVAFFFQDGPPPPCVAEGDFNGSGGTDIADLSGPTSMVAFFFQDGPPPVCGPE